MLGFTGSVWRYPLFARQPTATTVGQWDLQLLSSAAVGQRVVLELADGRCWPGVLLWMCGGLGSEQHARVAPVC